MGLDAPAMEDSIVLRILSTVRCGEHILLLCGIAGAACQVAPPQDENLRPEVILTGARLQSYKGSERVATGRAAQVTYQRESADLFASEVLLRFPSRKDEPRGPGPAMGAVEVRAPVVVGNRLTRQADGKNGVIVRTGNGMIGRTESAHFEGTTMIATGKEAVSVDGPKYTLKAVGFILHLNEANYQFLNQVISRMGERGD